MTPDEREPKMKILITQDTDWILRNPGQQHHLADELSARGHTVRVVDYDLLWRTKRRRGTLTERAVIECRGKTREDVSITVIRPKTIRIPFLDYVSILLTYPFEIARQLRKYQPDIVIAQSILTNFLSIKLAKKAGVPVVFHALEAQHTLVPRATLRPVARLVEMYNFRHATATVVINEKLKEYAVSMGADPKSTFVVRAGVDLRRYDPRISGEKIRKECGFDKDDFVLFFMGWLYHFSGLKEVATELSKHGTERTKLLIVGDGDALPDLASIVHEKGLRGQVVLAGKRPYPAIPEYIAAGDVCILPAYDNEVMRDIVPIKMYEYLAMGKPVVCTNLQGVRKEFGEGNGVVYVDRPTDVIDEAIRLRESGELLEEGKHARTLMEGKSWDKVTNEFESLLRRIIRGNGKESD